MSELEIIKEGTKRIATVVHKSAMEYVRIEGNFYKMPPNGLLIEEEQIACWSNSPKSDLQWSRCRIISIKENPPKPPKPPRLSRWRRFLAFLGLIQPIPAARLLTK